MAVYLLEHTLGGTMNIVLIVLMILAVTALPTWPYSASWGYGPSGGLGVLLLVVLLLLFSRRRVV